MIIRNPANGKFVIGALFRRERDNPGPELQISSDAAEALGILAGAPGKINVTALRRDEEPAQPTQASRSLTRRDGRGRGRRYGATDVAAEAAAAIDRAEGTDVATEPAPTRQAPAQDGPQRADADRDATRPSPWRLGRRGLGPCPRGALGGDKRFQIGIFSVEANAQRAVDELQEGRGLRLGSQGSHPRQDVLECDRARRRRRRWHKIKAAGFADAYGVKG